MSYYEYRPTLERRNELIKILDSLKQDYEKVSYYSELYIQMAIEAVENELNYYKKRIYDFDTGDSNIIYRVTFEDYTDDELQDADRLFNERQRQHAQVSAYANIMGGAGG